MGNRPTYVFESKVVQHCSPTLAGIKPANLFNCKRIDDVIFSQANEEHASAFADCRKKVARGGVSLTILLQRKTGALVLAYRLAALAQTLSDEHNRAFLSSRGYDVSSPGACIKSFRKRFEEHECHKGRCGQCDFPHEIGLLLGYPLADVTAFIENHGHGEKCIGNWKVYSDVDNAKAVFDSYKAQTCEFTTRFANGIPIDELAMVGASMGQSA